MFDFGWKSKNILENKNELDQLFPIIVQIQMIFNQYQLCTFLEEILATLLRMFVYMSVLNWFGFVWFHSGCYCIFQTHNKTLIFRLCYIFFSWSSDTVWKEKTFNLIGLPRMWYENKFGFTFRSKINHTNFGASCTKGGFSKWISVFVKQIWLFYS